MGGVAEAGQGRGWPRVVAAPWPEDVVNELHHRTRVLHGAHTHHSHVLWPVPALEEGLDLQQLGKLGLICALNCLDLGLVCTLNGLCQKVCRHLHHDHC
jgi:hypothetical protein